MEKNISLCKSAAGKTDQPKSEKIADQKKLLEIHEGQAESVQETAKSEMKSWTDSVKKDNQAKRKNLTENTINLAVRLVNEDKRRFKNRLIYGCFEYAEEEALGGVARTATAVYKSMVFDLP